MLLSFNSYEYLKLCVISISYNQVVLTILVLGTDRVEQMTRTYNDIDMVTHLLAEVGMCPFSPVQKVNVEDHLGAIKFAHQ